MQLISAESTEGVSGSILYHLEQDPAYEEIHQFEGTIEGNTLMISTDQGQFHTYTISENDLEGQVAFECFECTPWAGIELTRAEGLPPAVSVGESETAPGTGSTVRLDAGSKISLLTPFLSFEGHGSAVRTLDWSPDGTKVASSGEDNAVIIWDAQTGRVIKALTDASKISAAGDWPTVVSWQPDGNKILLGHPDGSIQSWDWNTDQVVNFAASTAPNPVSCLEFRPGGTEVAVCSPSYYDVGRSFIMDINSG